ncbi:copper resistance CopC family protein [Nocardioides sp.]|uniref:copper resistance CopC family protein n=1 Tax=Nocardioides sp. TaxID=35761 RepID=UPI0027327428|nr:copper resistance CopC family protein [Nocardioides sp.]MDP3891219.1 copper resistance protein CopC [Nocardioides sp.]
MSTAARHLPTQSPLATRPLMRALATGLALTWLLAVIPPAAAHTDLTASTPSAGASLKRAPREVTLTFSEQVSSALSAVSLQVTGGRAVPLNVTPGPDPNTIVAAVDTDGAAATGATRWLVRYRVTSTDGHPIAGELAFDVRKPPAPAPSPSGTSLSPTAEQSSPPPADAAAPPDDSESGTSIGVVSVLAAALLALLGIAARRVWRSRA